MGKVALEKRKDNIYSLTLEEHANCIIRIPDSQITPYREGTHRARAWQVISLMDGITVGQGDEILKALEINIQGQTGQPIGWIALAVTDGHAEIHKPDKITHQ